MSYDLILYKSAKEYPDADEALQLNDQAEQRLLKKLPRENTFTTQCGDILKELDEEIGPYIVTPTADRIEISFRFGTSGRKAKILFEKINKYLKRLSDCGGYYVWDPQKGRAFDPKAEDLDGLKEYIRGTIALKQIKKVKIPLVLRIIIWIAVIYISLYIS